MILTELHTPFVLEVDANPTTGYVWEIELPAGIELITRELHPSKTGAAGARGKEVFTLRATRPGRHVVTLKLGRPWEPGNIDTRTFSVMAGGHTDAGDDS